MGLEASIGTNRKIQGRHFRKGFYLPDKQCTRCKLFFPEDNFYGQVKKERNKIYNYSDSMCKPCRNIYGYEYKRNNKAKAVEYLGGKCEFCGLIDEEIAVYDFHHIDPEEKEIAISDKLGLNFERIKEELDKCILICANCHRRLEAEKDRARKILSI